MCVDSVSILRTIGMLHLLYCVMCSQIQLIYQFKSLDISLALKDYGPYRN